MALVKAKVSTVVPNQVPEFVREDNPNFIAFLEAYYEFLNDVQQERRNLEEIRDIDQTVDSFVNYFRNELMINVPQQALVDKRTLAKHIKQLYESKGSVKSYEFLFRILFNETPTLYFPKVDILKPSDGKYSKDTIMRLLDVEGDTFNLVGSTIHQGSSRANVESVIKTQIGNQIISEVTLNLKSLVGDFEVGGLVTGTDFNDNSVITAEVLSVVTGFDIINNGAYYSIGDPIRLISGTGSDALVQVGNIGYGSVTDIIIDTPGDGYSVGEELIFDNTDAGGASGNELVSAVAVITGIDYDSIVLENGSGSLLLETGGEIDLEPPVVSGVPVTPTGAIKSIELITGGSFYVKPPIVRAPTTGTGAVLRAIGDEIGNVTQINVTNVGVNYTTPPVAIFPTNLVFKNASSTFIDGEDIVVDTQTLSSEEGFNILLETGDAIVLEKQESPSGTIVQTDYSRGLMKVYPSTDRIQFVKEDSSGTILDEDGDIFVNELSGEFRENFTIRGVVSNTTAKIASVDHARIQGRVGAVGQTLGKFTNADGKISESSKKIQDSFFYQEYSYVIKVGQSIDKYRDAVKKLLHPVGLALFGEVTVQSFVATEIDVTSQISQLLPVIRLYIDARSRAFGNHRTNREDDPTKDKEQITLTLEKFIDTVLTMTVLESEFLPVIKFPHLTLEEIHLLDLRAEVSFDPRILIKLLVDCGMKAVGNYRTDNEDDETRLKNQAVLVTKRLLDLTITSQIVKTVTKQNFIDVQLNSIDGVYKLVLDELNIDGKAKAVGNYRTDNEDDQTLLKNQQSLITQRIISHLITDQIVNTLKINLNVDAQVSSYDTIYTLVLNELQNMEISVSEALVTLNYQVLPSEVARSFYRNLGMLEQWKFLYPPYAAGSKNTLGVYRNAWSENYVGTNNEGYWSSGFANTQIKDFANITIAEVINNPNRRVNYGHETHITIKKIESRITMSSANTTFDNTGAKFDNVPYSSLDLELDTLDNNLSTLDMIPPTDFTSNKVKFDNSTYTVDAA